MERIHIENHFSVFTTVLNLNVRSKYTLRNWLDRFHHLNMLNVWVGSAFTTLFDVARVPWSFDNCTIRSLKSTEPSCLLVVISHSHLNVGSIIYDLLSAKDAKRKDIDLGTNAVVYSKMFASFKRNSIWFYTNVLCRYFSALLSFLALSDNMPYYFSWFLLG